MYYVNVASFSVIFVYPDKVDDVLVLSELVAFNENYALLCNTISDIVQPLVKSFVEENLFAIEEKTQIANISSPSDKILMLLSNISSSLHAINTKGFSLMLKIMKERGGKGTQSLADHIMTRIKTLNGKLFHICSDDV